MSGVVTSVDDVRQLDVVLVPTFSMVAELHAHILLPWPESTAALVQTVVDLKKTVLICSDNTTITVVTCDIYEFSHLYLWNFSPLLKCLMILASAGIVVALTKLILK